MNQQERDEVNKLCAWLHKDVEHIDAYYLAYNNPAPGLLIREQLDKVESMLSQRKTGVTAVELKAIHRQIDTLLISAGAVSELYRKLNTLQSQGNGGWLLQCAPRWVGDRLVAVLVRPQRKG